MQLRDHEAKRGRVDAFRLDPRLIKIDPAYNIRDMKSERTREHIDELKVSIRDDEHRVKKAIEVRMVGNDVFVTDGECRLTAVHELIAEGVDIESIVCIQEAAGTDAVERVLNFAISGQSERYTALEIAGWCRRCLRAGATEEQIASAAGWKSKSSVKQHLDMLELSEPIKQHIRDGEIAATTARNIAKGVDPVEAEKLIRANLEENRRIKGSGKRSTKVTNKTLKRDAKAKAKPPAEAQRQMVPLHDELHEAPQDQEPSHVEPQSLPATATAAPVVQSPSPAVVAATAQPLSGIPEDRVEQDAVDRERDQGVVQLAAPQNGMKAIADALLPLARMAEVTDLDELGDDHVLEISVRDVKRGAAAWRRITGQTSTAGGEEIAA